MSFLPVSRLSLKVPVANWLLLVRLDRVPYNSQVMYEINPSVGKI